MKGLLKSWRIIVLAALAALSVLVGGCALMPDVADTLHDLVDQATVPVEETSD